MPRLLQLVGVSLVLIGLVAAFYGPLEIYVFYLFSQGGPFHYDGFGMGSLWFAALVIQNLGYYVIAAIAIPIGWGHVALRRWALTLIRLVLWFWLGLGIVVVIGAVTLLPAVVGLEVPPDVLWTRAAAACLVILAVFFLMPALGLWFYQSERVRAIFNQSDPRRLWTEVYPFRLLALVALLAAIIAVLHLAMFFQAITPVFGSIQLGRPMPFVLAGCILIFGILICGVLRLEPWSWWGSLVGVSLLALSTALSFAGHDVRAILSMMDLPAYEVSLLADWTLLHAFRPAGVLVAPLLAALALIVSSRRFFRRAAG